MHINTEHLNNFILLGIQIDYFKYDNLSLINSVRLSFHGTLVVYCTILNSMMNEMKNSESMTSIKKIKRIKNFLG